MRTRLWMAQHLVEPSLHPRADRTLEPGRLLVRLSPTQADDRSEQPFEQGMAPEDAVRGGPTRIGQDQFPAARLGDEPVRAESTEHLAGGLRAHPKMTANLRGRHPAAIDCHDPQREQVLLSGTGQSGLAVGAAGHGAHPTRGRPRGEPVDRRSGPTRSRSSAARTRTCAERRPASPGAFDPLGGVAPEVPEGATAASNAPLDPV